MRCFGIDHAATAHGGVFSMAVTIVSPRVGREADRQRQKGRCGSQEEKGRTT